MLLPPQRSELCPAAKIVGLDVPNFRQVTQRGNKEYMDCDTVLTLLTCSAQAHEMLQLQYPGHILATQSMTHRKHHAMTALHALQCNMLEQVVMEGPVSTLAP
jgi:hypothetical protein